MYITNFAYIHTCDKESNIVLNGITGAVDIVDSGVAEMLKYKKTERIEELDQIVLETLISRGYIFENEEDEGVKRKEVYKNYIEKTHSLGYTFAYCPTYGCNLGCVYCFEGDLTTKHEVMTKEMLMSSFLFIRSIMAKHPEQGHVINLYGGEPLLPGNEEIVAEILGFADHEEIPVDIITNGTSVSSYLPILTKSSMLKSIQISLDGPKEIHDQRRVTKLGEGTFDMILENIKIILSHDFQVSVRVNVDGQNLNYIKSLVEFFDDEGLLSHTKFSIYFTPVYSVTDIYDVKVSEADIVEEVANIFTKDKSNYGLFTLMGFKTLAHVCSILEDELTVKVPPFFHFCDAGRGKYISFGPDGQCYPCAHAIGVPELSVGSFYPEVDLKEDKIEEWEKLSIFTREKCPDCTIGLFCGGGCPYHAWSETGDLNKSIVCANSWRALESYLDYYRKRSSL